MKRLLVAVAVLLTACSVEVEPSTPPRSPGSTAQSAPPEATPPAASASPALPDPAAGLPYACGGLPFDVRVLSQPPDALFGAGAAADALREQAKLFGVQRGWWLAYESVTEAEFITRNGPELFDYIRFSRQPDGTWKWSGEGDCVMSLRLDAATAVRWVLDDSLPVGPETRVIRAIVSQACVSEPLVGRIQQPIIRSTADTVLIIFTVVDRPAAGRLPAGGAVYGSRGRKGSAVERGERRTFFDHCESGAPLEVEVDIGEPLGDRRLVDGATWPARDARQPLER